MCVQEHWLYQFQCDDIAKEFQCNSFLRAVDYTSPISPRNWRRGYGGTGFIWHNSLNPYIKTQPDGNERVTVITLEKLSAKPLCLISCYMPSGNSTTAKNEYAATLDILSLICDKFKASHNVVSHVVLDVGCDVNRKRSPAQDNKFLVRLKIIKKGF